MRWIFISLLVINAAYFGWEWISQRSGYAVVAEQPKLGEKGNQLQLLEERSPKLDADGGGIAGGEVTGKECVLAGPLTDWERAEKLASELKSRGYTVSTSEVVAEEVTQYLVISPPAESRDEALQTFKELQAKKIDSYLLSSGEFANGISLGVFNEERSARILRNRVMDEGFDAEIHRKSQKNTAYLVQIEPLQSIENTKKTLSEQGVAMADIKISEVECEKFALGK